MSSSQGVPQIIHVWYQRDYQKMKHDIHFGLRRCILNQNQYVSMNQDIKVSLFQNDQTKIRQYAMEIVNEATALISKEQIHSLLIKKHNVYQHLFYNDDMLLSKIKINIKYKLFDIPYFHKLKLDMNGKIYSTQKTKYQNTHQRCLI